MQSGFPFLLGEQILPFNSFEGVYVPLCHKGCFEKVCFSFFHLYLCDVFVHPEFKLETFWVAYFSCIFGINNSHMYFWFKYYLFRWFLVFNLPFFLCPPKKESKKARQKIRHSFGPTSSAALHNIRISNLTSMLDGDFTFLLIVGRIKMDRRF